MKKIIEKAKKLIETKTKQQTLTIDEVIEVLEKTINNMSEVDIDWENINYNVDLDWDNRVCVCDIDVSEPLSDYERTIMETFKENLDHFVEHIKDNK